LCDAACGDCPGSFHDSFIAMPLVEPAKGGEPALVEVGFERGTGAENSRALRNRAIGLEGERFGVGVRLERGEAGALAVENRGLDLFFGSHGADSGWISCLEYAWGWGLEWVFGRVLVWRFWGLWGLVSAGCGWADVFFERCDRDSRAFR